MIMYLWIREIVLWIRKIILISNLQAGNRPESVPQMDCCLTSCTADYSGANIIYEELSNLM